MTDNIGITGKKNNLKLYYWILVGVAGLIIGFGVVNIYLSNRSKKTFRLSVKTEVVKKFSDIKKAEAVLSWINTQIQTDNYSLKTGCECASEGCVECKQNTPTTHAIWPYVLWGQYKYYENTKDSKVLEQINKEMDTVIKSAIQYNLWDCRLMKDLYESKILGEQTKRKAELICVQTYYEGDVGETENENFKGEIDVSMASIAADKAVVFKSVGRFEKKDYQENFLRLATYTSDLCARYLMGIDKDLSKKTEAAYYALLQGYSLSGRNLFNDSLLGITTLDMYRVSKDNKYLSLAKFLFEKNVEIKCDGLNSCIYYALFTNEYSDLTKENIYIKKYNEIILGLINTNLDMTGLYGLKSNKGGFYSGSFYPTVENALMVGLLSENNEN